jgi:hypothetical protein
MKKLHLIELIKQTLNEMQILPQHTSSNNIVIDVPEDTSYRDFAKAVAAIIREEYGEHLYSKFLAELESQLGVNVS